MISSSLFLINKGHKSNDEAITILSVAKYLDEFNEENSPKSSKVDNSSTSTNKPSFQLPLLEEVMWHAVDNNDGENMFNHDCDIVRKAYKFMVGNNTHL